MKTFKVTINDREVEAEEGQSLLDVFRKNDVDLPVMCYFDGLSNVGACRLCLLEIEGSRKLLPACTTPAAPNQIVRSETDKLKQYRKMTVELFFSERNHVCSVCVANNNCELQDLGYKVGMDHVRLPFLYQKCDVDTSHDEYIIDHNRCIMCTRCVRVCDEVEGAHNWDVKNRGWKVRVISDFDQPWGESTTCTSCSKCLQVCPTGALWPKDASISRLSKNPDIITELIKKREASK